MHRSDLFGNPGGLQIGPVFDAYGPKLLIAIGGVSLVTGTMLLGVCEGKYATDLEP